MTTATEPALCRVLVALDASPQSLAALDAAAEVAAWHSAELQGLFVEDVNLIRMAALPAATEIDLLSTQRRAVDVRTVERRLRQAAAEAERALAATAARRRVRWAFRTTRGVVTTALLEAAGNADLIAIGRAGRGVRGPGRLGSTARALTARHAASVLVLQATLDTGRPVVAIFDGSACGGRAVRAAARFSEARGTSLIVIVPARDAAGAAALAEALSPVIDGLPVPVRARPLAGADPDRLLRAVREERPDLCVVGCDLALGEALIHRLADDLRTSIYVAGERGA